MNTRKGIIQFLIMMLLAAAIVPSGGREVSAAAAAHPVSVSGGYAHGLAAWSDGTVTGWGYNKYGQVGDGTNIDQFIPKRIAGLADIVQVAAGNNVSFALNAAGEVWGWGQTYGSYISDDPALPYQKRGGPAKLVGLHNVSFITTDGSAGIAVMKNGTATLWYPSYDENDNMRMKVRYLPLPGITGIRSVVIAGNDALFLKGDGSVQQLSIYNSIMGRIRWASDPVTVNTLAASGIKQMASSGDNAFLLRADGQALRWNKTLKAPSEIAGLSSVYKLQTGYNKLYVLKTNGTLWQWNYNSGPLNQPFQVKGAERITDLWGSTGSFGFAQDKKGTLLGWGEGFYGGLATGSGTVTNDDTIAVAPVQTPLAFLLNGETVDFYGTTGVINGKLYVPYSSVFKALGVKVNMTQSNPDPKFNNYRFRVWSFAYGGTVIHIKASDPEQLFINGKKTERTISLKALSDATQFPLQDLCELLGISLKWNKVSGEVSLGDSGE
ncbi:chromosome condensation regulator RCC1 [Paenibacillus tianjinensis]|uniref:Chromosome condensation regulator RCC1 n=1 Tax=Paenibacillus tianjinensis TaxID=2810347 RepID=A0ABX7LMT8_9BACL|nr:chromosome condensation regulator RCC1 [Paenibacillus tianjinensis]QSF47177.1 chromosome condensation regulator RCC1 [Paenibacillus tianjinensis]